MHKDAYKLICFDWNINGNRDVKFFEWDYWSLHWPAERRISVKEKKNRTKWNEISNQVFGFFIPIPPKGPVLYFGTEIVYQYQEVVSWNRALEAIEVAEVLSLGKLLPRTSVIQVLKFNFILMFWKDVFWVESWNIMNFHIFLQ